MTRDYRHYSCIQMLMHLISLYLTIRVSICKLHGLGAIRGTKEYTIDKGVGNIFSSGADISYPNINFLSFLLL